MRDDGVHRPGKAQLDGAAHLTAVQRTLDEGGHDSTEGADVEVVLARPSAQFKNISFSYS